MPASKGRFDAAGVCQPAGYHEWATLTIFEHPWSAVRVELDIAGSHVAVDDFSLEKFALQIRGDIVDAADLAAMAGGV